MKQLEYAAPQQRQAISQPRAARIFLRDNGICHLCGLQIRPGEGWDVDHVEELADGGKNEDKNLRIAHVRCHKAKSSANQTLRGKRDRIITQGFAGKPKHKWPKRSFASQRYQPALRRQEQR